MNACPGMMAGMVRFSLQRLLASTAIIACGCAIYLLPTYFRESDNFLPIQAVSSLCGALVVGAGVGNIFGCALTGCFGIGTVLLIVEAVVQYLARRAETATPARTPAAQTYIFAHDAYFRIEPFALVFVAVLAALAAAIWLFLKRRSNR